MALGALGLHVDCSMRHLLCPGEEPVAVWTPWTYLEGPDSQYPEPDNDGYRIEAMFVRPWGCLAEAESNG